MMPSWTVSMDQLEPPLMEDEIKIQGNLLRNERLINIALFLQCIIMQN